MVKTGWPLALVGSLGFIAGQLPTSQFLGPYLPDILGSLVCFAALLVLIGLLFYFAFPGVMSL